MTTTETSSPTDITHYCATHPGVETELACGKCGKYICPRCMVQSPVGARCRDCAQMRRLPMYTVSPLSIARIVGAAVGIGVVAGVLWGLLLPRPGLFGFFLIFIAMGAGYGMARALDWASGRKRGAWVQGAAVGGFVLAWVVRNVVVFGAVIAFNDIWALLFVAAASVVAWSQLR